MNRVTTNAPATPATMPSRRRSCHADDHQQDPRGVAPSAIRIPSSRVPWLTRYAITP